MGQKMDGKFLVDVFAGECADLRCDYLKGNPPTRGVMGGRQILNLLRLRRYGCIKEYDYQCDSGLLGEAVFGGLRAADASHLGANLAVQLDLYEGDARENSVICCDCNRGWVLLNDLWLIGFLNSS